MFFTRQVQHGEKVGRKIGFPTLNFEVEDLPDQLEQGVYAAYASVEGNRHKGALYLGPKKGGDIVLELHLLDFDRQIYGQSVEVEVLDKIRDPQKFNSVEEMTSAIKKDVEEIRRAM